MRAVQIDEFGGPEVLRFVETDAPAPGPGQIQVEVRACGTNPADWVVREGALGGRLPQGTGFEIAGVVSALGEGVEGTAVGDRVFGNLLFGGTTSGAAEFAALGHWGAIPDGMAFEQAAAIPMVAETAVRVLDEVGVAKGHTVFLNGGSGAVGQLATQIAVRRGARVIVTSGEAKEALMRGLGAEVTRYGEGLEERVRELAPHGVDRVVDMGRGGVLPALIALAGDPSRVVTITDFEQAAEFGVRASGREGTDFRLDAPQWVADAIAAGTLSLPVWRVEPWEKIAEVQEDIKSGSARGKTVLRVSA
ncbi:NADP-dependent oxidoreductase [Streptomyces rugosispiralis]|uniref:NADP-dependent oxidoreductase n=1 Tax=Streptomyces rugosispiralis TaxID=2967341 RepID=A0ABT1UWS1_9ACTN|nr:NADP-dependent oxidoreductase [Streptomyces rugosispiralis]MCQ8189580.1 NADP-dependent oxidoreductase [Streptomyces rugosispiralis]